MTDHKFTDEEIIFSLVCHEDWNEMCEQCPYTLSKACGSQLARNAIDLIKRQQAEIERLKKYNTEVAYKHYNDGVKEFAERLKEEKQNSTMDSRICTTEMIDNLVKEMVGDTE